MKLVLEIEFSPAITKEDLEQYGWRLEQQMTTIYQNTPGISKEFVGITSGVTE